MIGDTRRQGAYGTNVASGMGIKADHPNGVSGANAVDTIYNLIIFLITCGVPMADRKPSMKCPSSKGRNSPRSRPFLALLLLLILSPCLAASPRITGFRPPWGRPGEQLTVEGTGFNQVERIRLGNRPIRDFKVNPAGTSLLLTLPRDWDPKWSLAYPLVLKTGAKAGGDEARSPFPFYLLRQTADGPGRPLPPPEIHAVIHSLLGGIRYIISLNGQNLDQVIGLTVEGTTIPHVGHQSTDRLTFSYPRDPKGFGLGGQRFTVSYRGGTVDRPEIRTFSCVGPDQLPAASTALAAPPQASTTSAAPGAGTTITPVAIPRKGIADLRVWLEAAHITQATQRMDGSIPLVQGKDGTVRVFVRATEPNRTVLPVRITVCDGAGEVLLRKEVEAPFPPGGIPTAQEGGLSAWNLPLPGALIQPGNTFLAELLNGSQVLATFPADGRPQPMQVVQVPPIRIKVFPIRYNGELPELDKPAEQLPILPFRRMFPVNEVEVEQGEPFEPTVAAGDRDPLQTVLEALELKRLLDTPLNQRYYVGLFHPPQTGYIFATPAGRAVGATPLGFLQRTLVLSESADGETLAHELGHLLGLNHSPGAGLLGEAGGVDPHYPRPDGKLDEWGFNWDRRAPVHPKYTFDLMSYGKPRWISAYSYSKALGQLLLNADWAAGGVPAESKQPESAKTGAAAPVQRCLRFTGNLAHGEITFRPAFEIPGQPERPGQGSYQLVCLDSQHKTLAKVPFDVVPGEGGSTLFEVLVPLTSALEHDLDRLGVLKDGHALPVHYAWQRGLKHGPGHPPRAHRISGDRIRLDWEEAAFPGVLVRDAGTGDYRATLVPGTREFPGGAAKELEVSLSDGLRTMTCKILVE